MTSGAFQLRKDVTSGSKGLTSTSIDTASKKPTNNNVPAPMKESLEKDMMKRDKKKTPRQNKRTHKSGKRKTEATNVETLTTTTTTTTTTTAATTTKNSLTVTGSKESKKKRKKRVQKVRELVKSTDDFAENWRLSPPLGGRFLMLDPVFARNEEYILLAHSMSLRIYSTKTSLLARNIPIPSTMPTDKVVSYLLDPENNNRIYIATSSSRLFLWDWVEGKQVQSWNLSLSSLEFVSICTDEKPEAEFFGIIYAAEICDMGGILWRIQLPKASKVPIEKSSIYKNPPGSLSAAQILDGGNIVVITVDRVLAIGNKYLKDEGKVEWGAFRKYPMTFRLTCLDSRLPAEEGDKRKAKKVKKAKNTDALGDVVIGDDTGAMHVFHNVLRLKGDPKEKPIIRMLHWHRKGVRSVKWTPSGDYIISGGSETVLVMWQIETGHKQFLPHLGSVIERMVVSPKGSSYAILLSDNSAMVLSTTELKPKANIAGIQSRVFMPKEARKSKVPCVLHPTIANRLLVATPSSQLEENVSSPYLQTFDTYSDRHVARQALTRTNATIFNSGPEQDMILEPNVSQIAITADGEWLATIDEWKPPRPKAVDGPGSEVPQITEEEGHGTEVYLKFWGWSEKKKIWELVTRVDSPHPSASGLGAEDVFDLISFPKGHGFATIGADGSVRIWRAKTRTRAGGAQVRGVAGGLTSWGCRRVIMFSKGKKEIELSTLALLDVLQKQPMKNNYWGQVAFSGDGSVVAIATPVLGLGSNTEDSTIYLAGSDDAVVRQSICGLQLGRINGLGILERYLIILGSSKLLVWNLVNSSVQWELPLEPLGVSPIGGHLAVDHHSQTFAVALSSIKKSTKQRVFVFKTLYIAPLHVQEVNLAQIMALKSTEGGKGYMVLDAAARVQYISPILAPHVSVASQASTIEFSLKDNKEASECVSVGLSSVYLVNGSDTPDEEDEAEAMDSSEDDDGVVGRVVPREALESIFDAAPSYAAGSVEEAFEKVLTLFAKKPLGLDEDNEVSNSESEDEDTDM